MKREMKGAVSTCKMSVNGTVIPIRAAKRNTFALADDTVYLTLETHYYEKGPQSILEKVITETGLDLLNFCEIYNCSISDALSVIGGNSQRITPEIMQAILRAWSDIRFLNNEYSYWRENKPENVY